MHQENKLINDPLFGFIEIPSGLLYSIVNHPYLQRLNRIKQLGLSAVAFPGAQHTRFQHSLGAFFLMTQAIEQLKRKGHFIFDSEAEATKAAILLHDIGHGPFSHVLEHTLIPDISHEEISLMLVERMNKELNGALNYVIQIFKDEHPKKFLHQLVSGQIDMDRLDYLRRDSFFTGVREGNIGSERIIKMLDVKDDKLVIDEKGIYSIENFLIARRLMYWQVYLHKTSIASERMLVSVLLRAKYLRQQGDNLYTAPALDFFIKQNIEKEQLLTDSNVLNQFVLLDDTDIWSALKVWMNHPDKVLSFLSTGLINRRLFKIEISQEAFDIEHINNIKIKIKKAFNISEKEADYLISTGTIENKTYNPYNDTINLLQTDGNVKNISEVSDILNLSALTQKSKKFYLCYYRID